jgi:hypothetical protein
MHLLCLYQVIFIPQLSIMQVVLLINGSLLQQPVDHGPQLAELQVQHCP